VLAPSVILKAHLHCGVSLVRVGGLKHMMRTYATMLGRESTALERHDTSGVAISWFHVPCDEFFPSVGKWAMLVLRLQLLFMFRICRQ
jgi:hypothetical protein